MSARSSAEKPLLVGREFFSALTAYTAAIPEMVAPAMIPRAARSSPVTTGAEQAWGGVSHESSDRGAAQ